jgi:hypothetical protein
MIQKIRVGTVCEIPVDEAIAAMRLRALTLCDAARHHQRGATPIMAGFLHRMETVLEDFAHGIESATAALQC